MPTQSTTHQQTEVIGHKKLPVNAGAECVWLKMRDFPDLSWALGIAEVIVEGSDVGMVRRVRLEGSEEWLEEKLLDLDDDDRRIEYGIAEGMMGINDYRACAQVIPSGTGCFVEWTCSGRATAADQAEKQQVLMAVAEGITTLFTAQFARDK